MLTKKRCNFVEKWKKQIMVGVFILQALMGIIGFMLRFCPQWQISQWLFRYFMSPIGHINVFFVVIYFILTSIFSIWIVSMTPTVAESMIVHQGKNLRVRVDKTMVEDSLKQQLYENSGLDSFDVEVKVIPNCAKANVKIKGVCAQNMPVYKVKDKIDRKIEGHLKTTLGIALGNLEVSVKPFPS